MIRKIQAEELGLDLKKELDATRTRIALKNDMREYFSGKKDLSMLSRNIQAGQTEVKKEYIKYENTNIDLDNKSINN